MRRHLLVVNRLGWEGEIKSGSTETLQNREVDFVLDESNMSARR